MPDTFRALRHRNYRLFFAGQLISLVGTWMQNVAQAWLVYRLTGSSFLLGLVSFAGQIPVFFASPAGGALADRLNRHRILVGTQSGMMLLAFALAALTLLGQIQVWQIMILAVLLGIVNAFDIPARQAFVVEMVGRADLTNAIALNSSLFNSARMIGPAVAGVLVAVLGEGWCFFANGVSYVAVIMGLLLMRLEPRAGAPHPGSALGHAIEGFRYVWGTRPIRALMILLGIVSLVAMPYAVLMPVFAGNILHSGARGMGILMGASGIGALVGALSLARKEGVRGLGRWIAWSTLGLGVSLVLFALSRSFWLSAALLVPVGAASIVQMASSNTLIQTMAPDRLRGRIMSVYSMMFMGMAPLGALGAGAAASRLGAPMAVIIGGVICMVSAAVFRMRLPSLRPEARELILAQQLVAGDPPDEVTATG